MDAEPPTHFSDFIINKRYAKTLSLFTKNNMQNILIYGQPNIGKKTLIYSLINHLYDVKSLHVNTKEEVFKFNKKKHVCIYKYTKYYYEIDFSNNIKHSKHIINVFIKNICDNKSINNTFRIIIIHNFDLLKKQLIKAFIKIVEKYYKYTKFIFISNTNEPRLFKYMMGYFCTMRCHIDNTELTQYIEHYNVKLSKKITPVIYTCNNLFYINSLLSLPALPLFHPILNYVIKIYNIIKKTDHILFLDKVRPIIYEVYLLDFKLTDLILQFIKYIIRMNKKITDEQHHLLYHFAAKYDSSNQLSIQPFTLAETFFIQIKILDVCK